MTQEGEYIFTMQVHISSIHPQLSHSIQTFVGMCMRRILCSGPATTEGLYRLMNGINLGTLSVYYIVSLDTTGEVSLT